MSDSKLAEWVFGLPRFGKRIIVLIVDCLLCVVSVQLAFYLRLGDWQPLVGPQLFATIVAVALSVPVFIALGLYRAIFRYSGVPAITTVARACVIFAIPYVAIFSWVGVAGVPRTIGILVPILLFLFVAGNRTVAYLSLGATYRDRVNEDALPRAVIYGAGGAGRQLASAILQSRELALVGFIDDDRSMIGSTLNGKPIFSSSEVARLKKRYGVSEILLAIPSVARARRAQIVSQMTEEGFHVRTLPAMIDIARGKISVADLKEVAIEDLLSRQAIPPDQELLSRHIIDHTVLVTGAGGSIGSELCRQITKIGPTRLLLIESSEFNLYNIHRELEGIRSESGATFEIIPLLASICDRERLKRIFSTWQPDTVYHAAAYKHVPLVEHNPTEGIANNVFGTLNTATLSVEFGVSKFILISSDKAVRPTNVMGATKRLAELIIQALNAQHHDRHFCMVRFGNVLGSSGSVVPLFRQQIAEGGPITITHEEMTRYFMTIPEAAQLVIQAGAMANGGEVFLLEMGEPVRIFNLARNMIKLSGLSVRDEDNPHGDIEIEVVGLRPGEKLYEELLIGNNPTASDHPRIMKSNETFIPWPKLYQRLRDMNHAVREGDVDTAREILLDLVPEFSPQSGIVDWIELEAQSDHPQHSGNENLAVQQ